MLRQPYIYRFMSCLESPNCCRASSGVNRAPQGAPFVYWWRWRESNSRPQALCFEVYMLIPSLILLCATRRAGKTHSQFSKVLTDATLNKPLPRFREVDPWDPNARTRTGQRTLGWFLSS